MDRIIINDEGFGHEIARAAHTHYNPSVNRCIARARDGACLAGAIYTNYTHESIMVHAACFDEHGVNRDLLWCAFDYPFNQLKVKRIFSFVPEHLDNALAINQKLGLRPVARIEGMFRHGVACIVMRLDREDCRFLSIRPRWLRAN